MLEMMKVAAVVSASGAALALGLAGPQLLTRWKAGRAAAQARPRRIRPAAPSIWTPEAERRLRLGAAAGGAVLGYALGASAWLDPLGLLLALAGGAAGWLAPTAWLRLKDRLRRAALDTQFPDVLEMIANSLRAGLSLPQALEVVMQEAPSPSAGEFAAVVRDIRLGLPPQDALDKLSRRWPNREVELFAAAAGVSLRTGGNLAEVSASITATVRERFRLKRRIKTLTSQGKMSGWIVGLLPVALLVGLSFLDPELIRQFLAHPLGWAILGIGAVMEAIGVFVIFRIVDIEV